MHSYLLKMNPGLDWSVPILGELLPSDLAGDREKKYTFWTRTCLRESAGFGVLHVVAECCAHCASHESQAALIMAVKGLVNDGTIWKELCEVKSHDGETALDCYKQWLPEPLCETVTEALSG